MESSKEFGTTYIDMLWTVVPTGTGWAVLPTVSGMQLDVQTIDSAAPARNATFHVMIQPRLELRLQPRAPLHAGLYVSLRSKELAGSILPHCLNPQKVVRLLLL